VGKHKKTVTLYPIALPAFGRTLLTIVPALLA